MPNYRTLLNGLTFADALALAEKQAFAVPDANLQTIVRSSASPPNSLGERVAKAGEILGASAEALAGDPWVRLRNHPNSGNSLTADELAGLKREFGWSPTGAGDLGAAVWEHFRLNGHPATPFYDGFNAQSASGRINVQGCAPGIDYDPRKRPQGDCRDGIRHALWSARMAQRSPDMAAAVGDGRERMAPSSYKSHYMDLHNNRIGRDIGAAIPDADYDTILGRVADAVRAGRVVADVRQVPSAPVDTEMTRRRAARDFKRHDSGTDAGLLRRR
ncbi:hypothetical protein NGR_c18890 [Sinorhizobium fredii NGR234]|uniref:DUF6973 domain-containing protein n=1 Tax=Sinorhizobium fredii (strain NBRC 101917 / NGR234) TaxID=394 RepID=C3MDY4_SINFN|nr:hypothetical protein [Sinorhizobium fredii]ACP25653.1 hypothetical protein NGR_c18890 [Sinorhizobium fredii NGR234]